MNIKDVVNRDLVNLENCDQEPIHIPGTIQPHGFLIALKKETYTVEYCSENLKTYTGLTHAGILQQHFTQVVGNAQFLRWKEYASKLEGRLTAPLELTLGETSYQCTVHLSNDVWITEFEPVLEKQPLVSHVYDQTMQFVKYVNESATLKILCSNVADEIKRLTGYNRVMIYKFDKDYNGEVFAESKEDYLESFLGLHYPHTDIPAQARQLYIKNLLRIIVDVNYKPVPIYTIDDSPGKNIDLSYSVLRSVSPMHIQYLQNMGVGATLTISLIDEGKLWGLIACHHYSPKYIDHYTRVGAQLQGNFLTSQIKVRQLAEEYTIAKNVNQSLESMLNRSYPPDKNSLQDIISSPGLLSLANAEGVSILLDGVVYKAGITPGDNEIAAISEWADKVSNHSFYVTSKLSDDYEPAKNFCSSASGIIYYALKSLDKASITWYKPETLEEVYWAGDPDKAIIKNKEGLSPRRSFEKWKEIIKCQSGEWTKPELTAAANFAYALQKHVTLILLTEEEKRQKQLSDELKETNAELENINWISTHDMKEPLRKIQMFSSRLLSRENVSKEIFDAVNKMSVSAAGMMKLIDDLTSYAKARNSNDNFDVINLDEELAYVIRELHDEIEEKNAMVKFHSLPKVNGNELLLKQLFLNLLRNALKFSRKGMQPVITISATENWPAMQYDAGRKGEKYNRVTISDNGIGFDQQFAKSIFDVFTKLHLKTEYEGSGIGLALCRKIMKLHGGFIEGEGRPGEGASFHLFFPLLNK
jgi:light-regulated signal transduction histidine kinase (bacteriophytochrome)